jgi:hypothetical protein
MSKTSKEGSAGADAKASKAKSANAQNQGAKETGWENFWGGGAWESCSKKFQETPDIDLDQLITSHRKNMETIRQAQQAASELLQGVMNVNNQYVRSSFEDLGTQVRAVSAGDFEGVSGKNGTAAVKGAFDRSLLHCKQVTELFSHSTAKVFDCYRKRFDESLAEASSLMGKTVGKSHV